MYIVTLAPGIVRYIRQSAFFDGDIDCIISEIKQQSVAPHIRPPNGCPGVEKIDYYSTKDLLEDATWETMLRVHHALGSLNSQHGVQSLVYCAFHKVT